MKVKFLSSVIIVSIITNLASVKAATFSPDDLIFTPNQFVELEGDFLTGSISTDQSGQLSYFIETDEDINLGIPNVIYDSSNGETSLLIDEPDPDIPDDDGGTWEWVREGDRLVLRFVQKIIDEILEEIGGPEEPPLGISLFLAAEEWSLVFPSVERTGNGTANVIRTPESSSIFSIVTLGLIGLIIKLKSKS